MVGKILKTEIKQEIYNWQRKDLRYGSLNLDNWLSQNRQDIRWSHKVYREYHGNMQSEIDSWRKNLSWGENPVIYIPGRSAITIIICYSDDATQIHTKKMHKQIKT